MVFSWLPSGEWQREERALMAMIPQEPGLARAALARLAIGRGHFAEAARWLQEAAIESQLSRGDRAIILISSGWLGLEDARPGQALEDLKAAAADLPADAPERPLLDALMAEAFLRLGARPEAEASARRAQQRAASSRDAIATARACRVEAELAREEGDLRRAERLFQQAVQHAEEAAHPFELGQSLLALGAFLWRRAESKDRESAGHALALARTWLASLPAEAKLREVDVYAGLLASRPMEVPTSTPPSAPE